ncbi:hypothetical protein [Acetobacter cerevisiae]|uniref:hypothetical protein n=1 Tax=Acetobacter cerevisiae TaxID=178900 RepID=UPI0038D15E5E
MTATIGSVSFFSYFRLLSVLFISLYAVILSLYIGKNNIFPSLYMRMTMVIGLVFLPAVQIYASWAITYPFTLSMMLAFSAYLFLDGRNSSEKIKIFLSYGALSLSFLIYQPTAMVFVFFVFLETFFDETKKQNTIFKYAAILFFAMLTNFVFIKIYTYLYGSTGREALEQHIFKKILWFFNHPFMQSLANYNIQPSVFYTILSGCVVLYGVWCTPKKWNFFAKILMVVSFCFLSYVPNILAAETSSPYRTTIVIESILAVLFLNGIFGIFNNLKWSHKYAFSLVSFLVVMSAIFNINTYIIDVQQKQLYDLAAAIKSAPKGQVIDFDVRGVDGSVYSPVHRYEYGTLSIDNAWSPKGMAMAIIKNNNLNDIRMTGGILVSDPGAQGVYYIKSSNIKTLKY